MARSREGKTVVVMDVSLQLTTADLRYVCPFDQLADRWGLQNNMDSSEFEVIMGKILSCLRTR